MAELLAGKVIVVAGAGGIGDVLARRYANEGARVVVGDLNAEPARALARDVDPSGEAAGVEPEYPRPRSGRGSSSCRARRDRRRDPSARRRRRWRRGVHRLASSLDSASYFAFLYAPILASLRRWMRVRRRVSMIRSKRRLTTR